MQRLSLALALTPLLALAQSAVMETPRDSQRASINQRIELTSITIHYSRPLAKGRKLWGGIVPYGEVWRAGANENTTIEFTDPVDIEGSKLDKGTYGLHMIPQADSWTVIFSKTSSAWGSFTYDPKEDALRVTVKPRATAESQDALTYSFDALTANSTTVTMSWGNLAVGFKVTADPQATISRLRDQLRGRAKYTWDGWDDAARWCLAHKTNLEEALTWSDQSIQNEERFENQMTKAGILTALNRDADAKPLRTRALETGSAVQVYSYGRQRQTEKKKDEALEVYRITARRFPDHWLGLVAKARVAAASGDTEAALKAIDAARAAAPKPSQPSIDALRKRIEAKEDVNS